MTGMRPRECCTAMRISSLCSSKSTVGDSPVVPTTTMPSVPSSTCQSMSLRKRARSSLPSSCMGVTIATRLPVIMAAILALRHPRGAYALCNRRLGALHLALLEPEDLKVLESFAQLARAQQEIGIGRPAEALVAQHEGLVDE